MTIAIHDALDRLLSCCGARGRYHALEYADAVDAAEKALAAAARQGGDGTAPGEAPQSGDAKQRNVQKDVSHD